MRARPAIARRTAIIVALILSAGATIAVADQRHSIACREEAIADDPALEDSSGIADRVSGFRRSAFLLP